MTESIMRVWGAGDYTFHRDMWLEKYDLDAEPNITESFSALVARSSTAWTAGESG
jgi:hypothetical protein